MSDPTTDTAAPDVKADGGFDIFLSYNSRDAAEVQSVRRQLLDRGVRAFFDRHDLGHGRMWFDELQNAIARSQAVAVFVGPSGIGTWQKREMALALDRQAKADEGDGGARLPVIPVLLPGSEIEDAPGLLLLNTWLDLRRGLDDAGGLDKLAQAARGGAAVPRPASAPALPPYRDLRAFREEDAPLFFGREVFARELLEKAKGHGLVAVVGPSGSGKSSVVQAGLLPLLRRQPPPYSGWDAVTFTPGANPFHNLALPFVSLWERDADRTTLVIKAGELGESWANGAPLALAVREAMDASKGATDKLLVVADQFEELFTLTPEKLRRPFLEALLAASKLAGVTVLLTLRADFYGQAVGFSRELSDLMQGRQVNLGPMTRDELRRGIEEPARHVGLQFEPGLVGRILDHVEKQPGSLPLLEFALTELWQKRRGALLSNQAYDEIGGVEGAVSRRADAELAKLPAADADGLLRFLTRLVRVSAAGEEGADTRQRASLQGLDERPAAAVEAFVRARLLVKSRREVADAKTAEAADTETVEVAHEALIRRWPRLRERLDRDREFLLWRQRLRLRLDEYERTGRDAGTLLAGAPLKEALKFTRERREDLSDPEREYVEASDRAERERERELRRAHARPKLWAAVAAAVFVVALGVGGAVWAWLNSDSRRAGLIREDAARQVGNVNPDTAHKWFASLALSGEVDEALAAAKSDSREPALALAAVASSLARGDKPDEARRAVSEAAKAAESEQKPFARAAAFVGIARTRLALGQKEEARQAAAAALDAYRQYDALEKKPEDPAGASVNWKEIVGILLGTDQVGEARRVIDEQEAKEFGGARGLPEYACREMLRLGKIEEAKSLADVPSTYRASRLSLLQVLATEFKKTNRPDDLRWVAEKASADDAAVEGFSLRYVVNIFVATGNDAAAQQTALALYSLASRMPENERLKPTALRLATASLAKAGLLDKSLEALRRHFGGRASILGHVAVVEALDAVGRQVEARQVAEEAAARLGENARISLTEGSLPFLRILAETGNLDLARRLLRSPPQAARPAPLLQVKVARALFDGGKVDEALAFAGDSLDTGPEAAYRPAADLFVKAGRLDAYRAAVNEASNEHGDRSLMLITLAESLIEAGRVEEAKGVVREAQAEAAQADNARKLSLLARVAKSQARLGFLREGQEAVKDCSPDDKLEFYSVAALKYAGLDDRLLKALEPERANANPDTADE